MSLFRRKPSKPARPTAPDSADLDAYFRRLGSSIDNPPQARQKPAETHETGGLAELPKPAERPAPPELPQPAGTPVQHGPRQNEFTAEECRLVTAMCWAMESLKKNSGELKAKAVRILEDTEKKPEVGWKIAAYYAKEKKEYEKAKKHDPDKVRDTVFIRARILLMDATRPRQEVFDRYFNKEKPDAAMMTLVSGRATGAFRNALSARG